MFHWYGTQVNNCQVWKIKQQEDKNKSINVNAVSNDEDGVANDVILVVELW